MKKLLHIAVFSFILLGFGGCWGWGWFVPYSFQPSYHEFKKMCKLNELPNNEEKYNKILGYFDTDLDSLDWEELNKNKIKTKKGDTYYLENILEYSLEVANKKTNRYEITLVLYANDKSKTISKDNITFIRVYGLWYGRMYRLTTASIASYDSEWDEAVLACYDAVPTLKNIDIKQRIKNDK